VKCKISTIRCRSSHPSSLRLQMHIPDTYRSRGRSPNRFCRPCRSRLDWISDNNIVNVERVVVRNPAAGDTTKIAWKTSRRFSRWRTSNLDVIPSFLSCLVTLLVLSSSHPLLSKVPPIRGTIFCPRCLSNDYLYILVISVFSE
jgi:hypothetical protein